MLVRHAWSWEVSWSSESDSDVHQLPVLAQRVTSGGSQRCQGLAGETCFLA